MTPVWDERSFIIGKGNSQGLIGTILPTLYHSYNGVRKAGGASERKGVLRIRKDQEKSFDEEAASGAHTGSAESLEGGYLAANGTAGIAKEVPPMLMLESG